TAGGRSGAGNGNGGGIKQEWRSALRMRRGLKSARKKSDGPESPSGLQAAFSASHISIELRGLCRQRRLRLFHQPREAFGVVDGDISQYLAVQFYAGLLQPVDELRIAGAVELAGCGDADDPQRAELALLLAPAAIGELQAALDGFLRCLVELGFG